MCTHPSTKSQLKTELLKALSVLIACDQLTVPWGKTGNNVDLCYCISIQIFSWKGNLPIIPNNYVGISKICLIVL